MDLGSDLIGGGSVGHDLQVGDVGHDTAFWEVWGRILSQGGPKADREATLERTGRSMVIFPSGGRNGGGNIAGGGDL